MVAQFNIGDEVWTSSSGPWRVIARYWMRSQQRIAYDLRYANGVTIRRMLDDEVYAERQWFGYGKPPVLRAPGFIPPKAPEPASGT